MSVLLSPVVLLNISDSLQRNLSPVGVLRGYTAQETHILNSFEVPLVGESLENGLIHERNALLTQIFPEEGAVIGAYAIADDLTFASVQKVMALTQSEVGLVFSPRNSTNKDGKYYKVYDLQGRELRVSIAGKGQEAVDTVLELKDGSNEFTKSKDMAETQKDILGIIQERVAVLITALESEKLDYATLRRVNSLYHKLRYTIDDEMKEQLVELENDYKLILNTGIIHENISSLENVNTAAKKAANENLVG